MALRQFDNFVFPSESFNLRQTVTWSITTDVIWRNFSSRQKAGEDSQFEANVGIFIEWHILTSFVKGEALAQAINDSGPQSLVILQQVGVPF